MFQLKLRRALAVLTLTLAAAFATVPTAGAAVHPRGARPAHVRAVETPLFSWLKSLVVKAMTRDLDIGVRIDPDGSQGNH